MVERIPYLFFIPLPVCYTRWHVFLETTKDAPKDKGALASIATKCNPKDNMYPHQEVAGFIADLKRRYTVKPGYKYTANWYWGISAVFTREVHDIHFDQRMVTACYALQYWNSVSWDIVAMKPREDYRYSIRMVEMAIQAFEGIDKYFPWRSPPPTAILPFIIRTEMILVFVRVLKAFRYTLFYLQMATSQSHQLEEDELFPLLTATNLQGLDLSTRGAIAMMDSSRYLANAYLELEAINQSDVALYPELYDHVKATKRSLRQRLLIRAMLVSSCVIENTMRFNDLFYKLQVPQEWEHKAAAAVLAIALKEPTIEEKHEFTEVPTGLYAKLHDHVPGYLLGEPADLEFDLVKSQRHHVEPDMTRYSGKDLYPLVYPEYTKYYRTKKGGSS